VIEWFTDYRDRILNEFRRVRELEDQIALATQPMRDDAAVARLQGRWFNARLYEHTDLSSRPTGLRQPMRASSTAMTSSSLTAGSPSSN